MNRNVFSFTYRVKRKEFNPRKKGTWPIQFSLTLACKAFGFDSGEPNLHVKY